MAWTHRRFTWRLDVGAAEKAFELAKQVKEVLSASVNGEPKHFRDAKISGMAYGLLEFACTISDRDRWWVGRRARLLADVLRAQTHVPLDLVAEDRVKLPAHMHRGKRWLRENRSGKDESDRVSGVAVRRGPRLGEPAGGYGRGERQRGPQ